MRIEGPARIGIARQTEEQLAQRLGLLSEVPKAREPGIGALAKKALNEVNELQAAADREAERVATGDATNLHDAIIAMEKAHLTLQLTAQTTRKAVEAYKEIMRMQV